MHQALTAALTLARDGRGAATQFHALAALKMPTGGLLGLGAGAVFNAAGQWVAGGASWILAQLVRVISATTAPPIGTAWFSARLDVMAAVGATLVVPMACCAAVQAVLRQSPGMALRSIAVHLPVAVGFTGTAVALVQMALAVTDSLSEQILSSAGTTVRGSLSPLSSAFASPGALDAPSFIVLLGAVVVVVAGLALWLEMAVRSAAVSVAVLFLPLVMAALVWPAISPWCRRLADTLVALVLSKLVIVGALGLATAALGEGTTGTSATGGFGAVVTGAALLVVASAAPFTLLRLIPAIEAGATAQLEQARHHVRHAMGAPRRTLAWASSMAATAGAGGVDPGALVASIGALGGGSEDDLDGGGLGSGGGSGGGTAGGGGVGGRSASSSAAGSGRGGRGRTSTGDGPASGENAGAGSASSSRSGGAGGGAGGTSGGDSAPGGGGVIISTESRPGGQGSRGGKSGSDRNGAVREDSDTGRSVAGSAGVSVPSAGPRRRARTWTLSSTAPLDPGTAPSAAAGAEAPAPRSDVGGLYISQPSEAQVDAQREQLRAEMPVEASADTTRSAGPGSVGQPGGGPRG